MERTERLLDLVALLLDAHEPLPWSAIAASFPVDYAHGAAEANERKFERDKAELIELGIPIRYVIADEDRPDGYIIDKDAYYLPEVDLSPEEIALLYTAGSAALASGVFPGRTDLTHALRKIGFFASEPPPALHVRLDLGAIVDSGEIPARLEALWAAISNKKFVDIDYFSPHTRVKTSRRVAPYGIAFRRGVWNLVGFCHLRKALRVFHVHRIRGLRVNELKPRTADFQVPEDFKLSDYVPLWPWQNRFHDPMPVEIVLTGELRPLARRLFPLSDLHGDGESIVVPATDLTGLVKYVLSLGADAQIIGPDVAVTQYRDLAKRVRDAHVVSL